MVASSMTPILKTAAWIDGDAAQAADFYATVFRECQLVSQVPGVAAELSIHGRPLLLISGSADTAPNPSISGLLNFDPLLFGGEDEARAYLDATYEKLSGRGVLMELGEYPFSRRYAWVRDQFGFTWQLMLTDPEGRPAPFFIPSFMFGGINHGNCAAATDSWIELFDGERISLHQYGPGAHLDEGSVMFTEFTLAGQTFGAMDSGTFHDFTFSPGVSILVSCETQEQIDRYWEALSQRPESENCGWCIDRWDVSWQVVPSNINELMRDASAREAIMSMKKIDLAVVEAARK